MVGEIIVTVDMSELKEFMNNLKDILETHMPCDYYILIGVFTRTKTTISDYLKYGNNFENSIDRRYIGLVDSHSKTSETVKVIK